MASSSVSLNNSVDIVANSISVIDNDRVINVLDAVNGLLGIPPSTLDSLEKLARALNNDADYFNTVTAALNDKAATTYVDGQLSLKSNAADVYTKNETDAQIANLVATAPESLNTLNELANALGNDANFSTTVTNQIATKADAANVYDKATIDTSLALKRNVADSYDKTQTDTLLTGKVDNAALSNYYNKSETDTALNLKRNAADSYTKVETDTALNLKRNVTDSYTKVETDTALNLKRNVTDSYNKTETDTALNLKRNVADSYSITQTDALLNDKSDKTSTYTITQTNNLLNDKSDKANTYTKSETDAQISNIVGSAPETLNTLNELATALGNDANFSTTVSNQIGLKADSSTVYNKTEIDNKLNNNAAAWSSGLVTDPYHYIDTGSDALVIRTPSGEISANFLGNVNAPTDGNVIFYKDITVNGEISVGGSTLTDSLNSKRDVASSYSKTETDNLLSAKANSSNVYTKAEIDNLNNNFVSQSLDANTNRYKIQTDIITHKTTAQPWITFDTDVNTTGNVNVSTGELVVQGVNIIDGLNSKVESSTIYTKSETDSLLTNKADSSTVYTKTETDTLLNDKQDVLAFNNPTGGYSIYNAGVIKGFKTTAPLTITDANNTLDLKIDTTASLTINNLTANGITCSNPTSTTISANKNLTLGQTGDQYGSTYLHIRNRISENGIILDTSGSAVALADLVFRATSTVQRNLRLEARSEFATLGVPTWDLSNQFYVGDTRSAVSGKLTVGTTAEKTEALHVNGDSVVTGNLTVNGNANIGVDLICGDITCNALYGNVINQLKTNLNPFWVAGYCRGSVNPPVITYQQGSQTATVQRYSTYPSGGYFLITMPAHPRGSQWVPLISSHYLGNPRVWELFPHTSTQFVVGCLNATFNGVTNGDFWFGIYV